MTKNLTIQRIDEHALDEELFDGEEGDMPWEMQARQVVEGTTFAMSPSTRGPYGSADIPGMNLTFAPAKGGVLGTKGGLIDHIGFEVGNLAEFCRRLEAAGVKLDVPYTRAAGSGIASAFLTDPSGILIELTEGLGGY